MDEVSEREAARRRHEYNEDKAAIIRAKNKREENKKKKSKKIKDVDKVHFMRNSKPMFLTSACGLWLGGTHHTPYKIDVTCKSCKKTKFYEWCKDPSKSVRKKYDKWKRENGYL